MTSNDAKLILTGFMATGKSAIGRSVARRLGWRFDRQRREIVAARAGRSIAAIFADKGEAHFRALEREVIAALARDRDLLPAMRQTPPGSDRDRRRRDRSTTQTSQNCTPAGIVICLSARPEVIARRVERSAARRPKLLEGGKPLLERISELMARAGKRIRARRRDHRHLRTSTIEASR